MKILEFMSLFSTKLKCLEFLIQNKKIIKDSTDQKEIDNLTLKNQILREEIIKLKEEFKVNKQKAIEVYNSIKNDEVNFVKTKKQALIDFKKAEKEIKLKSLKEISTKKQEQVQKLDILAKKEYLKNYRQNVLNIKDTYQNNLVQKQVDLWLKYVNLYNIKI